MNNKIITISTIILILVIAGGIICWKDLHGSTIQDTPAEAKWIGKHAVLYVQTGCIHCEEQEDLFGINVKYLNIIDCFKESQKCIGIEATPTWIINGQKYEGKKTIKELKE